MAEPIVFISRFHIREGRAAEFAAAFAAATATVEATKPRTFVYAAYADGDGNAMRIVHCFADGEALTDHFAGWQARAGTIADLVDPAGFEIYGPAPPDAVAELRQAAAEAGVELATFPDSIGGFARPPT